MDRWLSVLQREIGIALDTGELPRDTTPADTAFQLNALAAAASYGFRLSRDHTCSQSAPLDATGTGATGLRPLACVQPAPVRFHELLDSGGGVIARSLQGLDPAGRRYAPKRVPTRGCLTARLSPPCLCSAFR